VVTNETSVGIEARVVAEKPFPEGLESGAPPARKWIGKRQDFYEFQTQPKNMIVFFSTLYPLNLVSEIAMPPADLRQEEFFL
jgi:hypothetical protein